MAINLRQLLLDARNGLSQVYGDRLKGMYLYGSYARGEADAESDVDILVVLDRIEDYGEEMDRPGAVVSGASLRYGVSISRVFVSEQDWKRKDTFLLANARAEAVPA